MGTVDFLPADIVLSLRGRDRNLPFVVLRRETEHLFLSDGRVRKVANPKKKKTRHVRPLSRCGSELRRKIELDGPVTNREIRKELFRVLGGGNILAER